LNPSWATYLIGNTVDIRSLAPGYDANGNEIQWNPVPAAANPYFVAYKVAIATRKNASSALQAPGKPVADLSLKDRCHRTIQTLH
jgi:hypothetical protein